MNNYNGDLFSENYGKEQPKKEVLLNAYSAPNTVGCSPPDSAGYSPPDSAEYLTLNTHSYSSCSAPNAMNQGQCYESYSFPPSVNQYNPNVVSTSVPILFSAFSNMSSLAPCVSDNPGNQIPFNQFQPIQQIPGHNGYPAGYPYYGCASLDNTQSSSLLDISGASASTAAYAPYPPANTSYSRNGNPVINMIFKEEHREIQPQPTPVQNQSGDSGYFGTPPNAYSTPNVSQPQEYMVFERDESEGPPPKKAKVQGDPFEVLYVVPARLSNTGVKYEMFRRELERRINGPEELNSSSISAILRKAKCKDNPLWEDMKEKNVGVTRGRRKKVRNSLFTSLLEAEIVRLLRDLEMLVEKYFPRQFFADLLLSDPKIARGLRRKLNLIESFLLRIIRFIERYDPPIAAEPERPSVGDTPFDQAASHALYALSCVTHGFGARALAIIARALIGLVNHIREKAFGQPPAETAQ